MCTRHSSPVLHLRSTADLSGPDRVLLDLLPALTRRGVASYLAALSDRRRPAADLIEAAREAGVPVRAVASRGPLDPVPLVRLARLVDSGGYALVHAHDPKSHVLAASVTRRVGIPWIAGHHGWLSRGRRERLYQRAAAAAMRTAARIVCVSDAGREDLILARVAPPGRIDVVPNGIRAARVVPTTDRAGARRQLGVHDDRPLLLSCGRLDRGKGPHRVLRAAAALERRLARPVAVALLGEGPERRALRALAVELGIGDRVCMPGFRADAPRLYDAADVFLLASDAEQHPVALLEAMAAGLPVVATRVGGVPVTVRDRHSGCLVTPGDDPALVDALAAIVEDPAFASALGRAARERVDALFTEQRMAEGVCAVYERVAG
jgi:glycosyltransferase involved in cell wall biosynthesis